MKRLIRASQSAYNYDRFILQYEDDGWMIYDYATKEKIAGPFYSWIESETYIDDNLE